MTIDVANKNVRFVALVVRTKHLEAKESQFFAVSIILTALSTRRSDA